MATFEEYLQILDKLVDSTPDDVLLANQALITSILKKLSRRQSTTTFSVLERLKSVRQTVEEHVKLPVNLAVESVVNWGDVDLRVHDIRLGTNEQNSSTRFRKGLGERSLAAQYYEWELQSFGLSRLDDLFRAPEACKDVADGNIPIFIKANGLPNLEQVTKGIQHGTKLLLLERLVGRSSTSAILFFTFTQFRAVKYADARVLADQLRTDEWFDGLTSKIEPWFQQCRSRYEDEITKRRHKRQHCWDEQMSEHFQKRARTHQDLHAQARPNDRQLSSTLTNFNLGWTNNAPRSTPIHTLESAGTDTFQPRMSHGQAYTVPRSSDQHPGVATHTPNDDNSTTTQLGLLPQLQAIPRAEVANDTVSLAPSFLTITDDFWKEFQTSLFNPS